MTTPDIETRRNALVTRAIQIIKGAGFNSRSPVPGMNPNTMYKWKRTKIGPQLFIFLAALDAAGYTLVITRKETVDAYEKVP